MPQIEKYMHPDANKSVFLDASKNMKSIPMPTKVSF